MQEQIRKLYKKLYNENVDILEEKKADIKKEKTKNRVSIVKSTVLRRLLKIAIEVITIILFFVMIRFVINANTLGYLSKENIGSFVYKFIIPFFIIMLVISFIYRILIRPRRTIQRNYWVKNSTTAMEEYNNVFCERIFKPVIEYVIPNSQYDHSYGIAKELYESMGFLNSHEMYISTDNISFNNNTNFIMSKVHTKFKDSGGGHGYWYATLFCGIASIKTLTFRIPISIEIRNRKLDSLKLKNTIQLSNEEFNKYYEIEANNPELLNKYFTDKVLNYFIELAKKNINLEVNIFENKICIRLHDKDFLEFSINSEVNEEEIINNCNSIIAIINTNNFIENEFKSNKKK